MYKGKKYWTDKTLCFVALPSLEIRTIPVWWLDIDASPSHTDDSRVGKDTSDKNILVQQKEKKN